MKCIKQQAGFTLIELSISIVIIGLIVAGVVGGQELIRAAQLRETMNLYKKYDAAYNTFKLKYDAVPGDIINPTDYGFQDPTYITTSYRGDGLIDDGRVNNGKNSHYDGATQGFWSHLGSNGAGILSEGYGLLGAVSMAGNGPYHGYSKYWIAISTYKDWGSSASWEETHNGLLPGAFEQAGSRVSTNIYTAAEAQSIDKKIDDGAAGTGLVMASGEGPFGGGGSWTPWYGGGGSQCVVGSNSATVSYNIGVSGKICVVLFKFSSGQAKGF